jgi:hypothetical protein
MGKDNIIKGLFFLSLLLTSCASNVTTEKIDAIIKKQSMVDCDKEKAKLNEAYENDEELRKDIIKNKERQFNNAMALRGKVIDSLKMLNYKKSLIIESTKDLNGLIATTQYFFFGNKIYSAGYDTEIVTKDGKGVVVKEIPVIEEVFIKDLKAKYQNDILEIYNHFNQDTFSKIKDSFDCTPSFGSYKVTLMIGNKIGYYGVLAKENCKVSKYN